MLVTGASGFVGRSLVCSASGAGSRGVAVSRSVLDSVPNGWRWIARSEILNGTSAEVEVVVHLEAKHHVALCSAADVALFGVVNVEGTQRWLDWCTARRVSRFVYFSSIKAVEPEAARMTDEQAGGTRSSLYGNSKWDAEQRVRRWVAGDASRSALILRPAVVYGPGNVANVAAMVRAIHAKRFFLVGENSNVKSMISVKNVAAAVVHLLDRMEPGSCEVYNLVDRESYTVRQIDAMIRAKLGRKGNSPTLPVPIARAAARFGDAFYRVSGRSFPINSSRLDALLEHTHFSCQKLLETGFQHPQSTEEGLGEMVDWCLRHA